MKLFATFRKNCANPVPVRRASQESGLFPSRAQRVFLVGGGCPRFHNVVQGVCTVLDIVRYSLSMPNNKLTDMIRRKDVREQIVVQPKS